MAGIKETSYAEFSGKVHGRVSPSSRSPISATIEVTRRCNLSCVHCYNNLPVDDRDARSRELSLEEYRRILGELAEAGTLWILFTGGEVFARSDFMEIYRDAKQKGFLITLFTNGLAIDDTWLDFYVVEEHSGDPPPTPQPPSGGGNGGGNGGNP